MVGDHSVCGWTEAARFGSVTYLPGTHSFKVRTGSEWQTPVWVSQETIRWGAIELLLLLLDVESSHSFLTSLFL